MTKLKDRIISRIRADGPITVAEYMTLCLLDPIDGYYPTRDPLGSDGDFITAPEISQMFGEVLGLWTVQTWKDMGFPKRINLVELGPGRGIMMADMLRSAQLAPDFLSALNIVLIEASSALEAVQAETLSKSPAPVTWAKDLSDVPDGPTIIIGNEYLDCLPIRQFVQKDPFAGREGWHERVITLTDDNQLSFALSPVAISQGLQAALPTAQGEARTDQLIETCPSAHQLIDQIKTRSNDHLVRAIFIDYGPETTEFGDTLQALKRHEKVNVFAEPGNSDLTARVDFSALAEFATSIDLNTSNIVTQSAFLSRLGIEVRAVTLARAKPDAKDKLARQLDRLMSPDQMGTLFKAICFQSNGLNDVLGF